MRALWGAIGQEQHKTLKKCFSAEGGFAPPPPRPQGHLAMLEPFLVITAGVVLLTSQKQRPGMLLKTLPCTGQASEQRTIWPQMATVLRLRKPTLETDTSTPSQESLGDCGPGSATLAPHLPAGLSGRQRRYKDCIRKSLVITAAHGRGRECLPFT